MYLDQTPTLLAALQDAAARQDAEGMRQTAHAFKSNCGHVGAVALVALCQQLEDRGAAQLITDTAALLRVIETEYASVRDALNVLLQEASA
jgi:HPt (histidine-containing phosphotransfer) domain-containing protein